MTAVRLGDVVDSLGGGTPSKAHPEFYGGSIPWVTPKDMKVSEIGDSQVRITEAGLAHSAARLVPPGSVLLVVRSGVLKHTLPVALTTAPVAINQDVRALIPQPRVDARYLAHLLRARAPIVLRWVRATTADNFPFPRLMDLRIPVPPLSEQRRIAKVLDLCDALRARRRRSLWALESVQSVLFTDAFGNVGNNSKSWATATLGSLASKFSDGPFGSNLKSADYVESGVRVVRLQNIGVGEFNGSDAAYINDDHFATIAKHECLPGDVLIGTLGDPNIRACLLPDTIDRAVNKADCVQMRVDTARATREYVVGLLNQPPLIRRATALSTGQTRTRISMGRLRELSVPAPPRSRSGVVGLV